jgi:hypothetical protein
MLDPDVNFSSFLSGLTLVLWSRTEVDADEV